MDQQKTKIIGRLRRIEGQVRGLARLIESGAPCVDVLTQVAAVTSAMKKAGAAVISAHLETCLTDPAGRSAEERSDFRTAITRFIDLS
ncbi:MAG: metal-sensitive transcriptional regulator [Deltaproteobacteria bacterium]|nr:metal-sensitive transcriptional regulator [Deltaproteobacteria bacterium]